MKFMKLGSRPDTFYTTETIRSVSTEVSSDLIVQVKGGRYLLHKFPLLSKCLRLQRLCAESANSSPQQIIQLPDFPGGLEAFETCAKFCYGITITISAFNIVSLRCAAEYLQMTEEVEKGNLIYKIEVFFGSCILRGWKDSILALQSTKFLPLWCEDLGITTRCVDAVATKVLSNPTKVNFSHSLSRSGRDDASSCNGATSHRHVSKGWWAEDLAELGVDLYWRTMVAIKSGGRVPANLIGDALKIYASRWLLNISKDEYINKREATNSDSFADVTAKHRFLLESVISLIPMEKGSTSCSFLLKLLKAANILGTSSASKMELARRVGFQLEEASVSDLLIPSLSNKNGTVYDVDIVMVILDHFMLQGQSPPTSPPRAKFDFERRRSRSAENIDFEFQEGRRSSSASHSSKLRVAKLIDRYLQEIARDVNLPLSKLLALAEAIPDFARIDHDDLYKAIDIYLKSHPDLGKSERKKLCRVLDCKKLSMEACMHAAQNELLPLRVVVQVLFFEQARATMAGGQVSELPGNLKALLAAHEFDLSKNSSGGTVPTEDEWSVSGLKLQKSKLSTLRMKLAEEDHDIVDESFVNQECVLKNSKFKSMCLIPPRPKKMFSKLWPSNRSVSERH